MTGRDHGYDRGWHRYGFDSMAFAERRIHGGGADMDLSLGFHRGPGLPHCGFGIVYPGRGPLPAVGMHVHRDAPTGEDLEEWYIIVEGTGVQRFTNGDSVEFGPGDLIACYPGTGHSLEATGDQPVKFISLMARMFTRPGEIDPWPERFEPRIRVLEIDDTQNPLSAECSICGARWERPEDDRGANTIATWSVDHDCTEEFGRCTSSGARRHLRASSRRRQYRLRV